MPRDSDRRVPISTTSQPSFDFQSKTKSAENVPKKRSQEKKEMKEKEPDSRKLLPYPEVKPPTYSQKKRREYELEKEKKEKIAAGFYQVSDVGVRAHLSASD